ncbi:MAG: spore coat protein CotS family [Clostridia bacterium]|nr:spore coat protein CotS family [Clostridia bacterium]
MSEVMKESIKELDDLAVRVLQEYDITPKSITIIQSGSIKTVWKVNTANQVLCLKRLKQTYDKVQFSVNAQIYIKKSGGNVPGIILNREGQPVVQYNDQLFVVYEWLEGKDLNFSNKTDLEAALKGLAAFHKASKGYQYPEGARESVKFGRWPEQYTSMRNRFETWKDVALQNSTNKSHFGKSPYNSLSTPDSDLKVLCHQDFGKGNAISTAEGIIVLDLDSVTYDFSARDLRKIIGKLAVDGDAFNVNKINEILNWYSSENPITDNEKKILYIDLLFPHWFHGLIKDQYIKNKQASPSEIERMARFEKAKIPALMKLLE